MYQYWDVRIVTCNSGILRGAERLIYLIDLAISRSKYAFLMTLVCFEQFWPSLLLKVLGNNFQIFPIETPARLITKQ